MPNGQSSFLNRGTTDRNDGVVGTMARHDGDIKHSSELGPLDSRQEAQMTSERPNYAPVFMPSIPRPIAMTKSTTAAPYKPMKKQATDNQKQMKHPPPPSDARKSLTLSMSSSKAC